LVLPGAGVIDTIVALLAVSLVRNRTFVQSSPNACGFEELAEGAVEDKIKLDGQEELSTLTNKFNESPRQVRTERSQLTAGGNRLFDIVRSIRDGVIILDASGSVLFANAQARERLSLAGEKVEGKPLTAVLGEKHELVNLAAAALATGAEAHDVPIEPTGGSSVLVRLFKLGGGRNPAGLLIILRDLRSVVEIERALDYSNRLARLLSGVAHQLRRPLQGMNLRLELLRSDNGERKDRHLDRLREAIDRLDSSIEALDRFANPGDLTASNFDLNQLLRELAARVRNDHIQIEFGLAEALPEIYGDRSMISEALANIITNAVEAMPQGGVLRVESRPHDGQAEIIVADSGSGIPQDNLAQIFELYFTTKPEGRGLGLSLALRAIELNRGSIKVESCDGQGTTCHVSLPLASRPTPSAEQPDAMD
jgi:signal transduction histidine kinase